MNGVVILGLGDELYQRMAFNLCVSIKMSDPRIDITLVYNSELRLNTYEKNYFNKIIFTTNHKYDVIYSIRDLVVYDNILFIESNYLFFNNKQITWLFGEFKSDTYLDFNNGVKPCNKIVDTEFKGTIWRDYNDFNFFFIKRTAPIWNNIEEIVLKYNTSFDTACKIALNNTNDSKLELILETDLNDNLANIYKKYYGISISLNYKKGTRYDIFNTLLAFYQSKISKIQEFSNQQLINPYNWSYKPITPQKSSGLNLLIQYYITDEKRDKEILYCINRNLELPLIKNIIVFVESGELLINHPKLIKIPHARPKYKDLINWCNINLAGQLCAISNSDIYFDQTLNYIFNHSIENKFIALTRYNVHSDGNISFYNNKRSSDVWIFQAPIAEFGDFYTGIPHCDGRIVWEADANGLIVTNPSKLIYSYHLHNESLRSWTWEFDYIYGEVLDLDWTNDINSISNKSTAFVDYQIPQCGIDSNTLFNIYKNLNVSKGVWVEVGIGDGKSFASCMASAGWQGLLIDANKHQYEHCVKKYKLYDNIKILNATISNNNAVQTLYSNNNFTSLNIKYLNQNGYTYSQVSTICKKLSTIFTENLISIVDILIVDTNGTEADVISSIDFNLVHIKTIIVRLKSDDNKLNQDNYRVVNSILNNNYTIIYSNASYVIYSYADKNIIPQTIYLEDTRITEFLRLQLNDENIFKNWLKTIDYAIDLSNQVIFDVHRSGWKWVISELSRYLKQSNDMNFIGYIDDLIIYNNRVLNEYNRPFAAIVHYTRTTPPWLSDSHTIDTVLSNQIFKTGNCKSLYALSSSNAKYITNTYTDCEFLYHPAQECDNLWTPDKFNSNNDKKVILLGYYLRRFHSIYGLNTNYKKYIMHLYDWRKDHYNSDINWAKNNGYVINSSVNFFNKTFNNAEYDKLLSENIIFLDLWDSGANNSLIECIIRNTPVLIRRSQATIDYLGPMYPFYFDTLEEASIKINDTNLIIQTYNYLKNLDKTHLDIKFFIYNLVKSHKKKNTISTINRANIPIESAYELFMPTDTIDSAGGIYNPGYVYYQGRNIFLPRIEQYTEKERGVNNLWYTTAAIPYIIETTDAFSIIKKTKLKLINFPKGRIEDFRLFIHNNQIWANFIYVETPKNIYPCLALINLNDYSMEFKGKIKLNITTTPVEKNWVFFSYKNELYMIYSINPFRIFKIDIMTLTGVQVFNKNNILPWNIGYISSSTNPIKFEEDKFIMGIHTRDKSITYHQGFLIFDMNFNIIYCSNKPYFSNGDTDGINKGVFYTSALEIKNDTIYCFAGDGDWKSVVLEIKINNIK